MQDFLVLLKLLFLLVHINAPVSCSEIAANDHLLVWYRPVGATDGELRYQCLPHSNTSQYIDDTSINMKSISIGKRQNKSQLYFVVSGLIGAIPCMSKIIVNCHNNQIKRETVVFNESQYNIGKDTFHVTVDPHGKFAIGFTRYFIHLYDLLTLKYWSTNITWPSSNIFYPTAIDITTSFVYVVGSFTSGSGEQWFYAKANLYLMAIKFNNSKYDVNILDVWTSDDFETDGMHLLSISVSANPYGDGRSVLVGIPSVDTVHLVVVNSTTPIRLESVSLKTTLYGNYVSGYGTELAWLNQGRIVVVSDDGFKANLYTRLYYYDMLENAQMTNDTPELSIFPNKVQVYPERFLKNRLHITSSLSAFSTLYACNTKGQVLIIPPSLPGYHSVDYQSIAHINVKEEIFSFIPNSVQCSSGTYKNDAGVWPCSRCRPTTTTNSSNLANESNNSLIITCPQCRNKSACPLEFVTEINWLTDIKQNGIYPDSPEIDVFDDVLLFYIFQTNWSFQQPFFIALIVLLIVLVIAGLIRLLKIMKRFLLIQQYLTEFIRHFDLIGEGKLWFGGLISIVLLLITVFAARFSHSYHYRYPLEKQVCNETLPYDFQCLHNAKFDTSLQLLTSANDQYEQIFDLLNSQQFTLNVELINTSIHCGQILLEYIEGYAFLPFSCYTNDLFLYLSTELPGHNLNLKLSLISKNIIGAIRVGLSGTEARLRNNSLQKLNFSQTFNRTNHSLSSDPFIFLQLTKSINITESLTDNDNTTYTGLWLPTFTYDANQIFRQVNSSENQIETILSLRINEMVFFIRNKQEPIARRSEIIFHTILFLGVCIDLTCMILLLFKLWLCPILIFLIRKLFDSNSFIRRLVHDKKSSSDTAVFLEIQRLKEQTEIMAKRIEILMKLRRHSDPLIEPDDHSIINEKF